MAEQCDVGGASGGVAATGTGRRRGDRQERLESGDSKLKRKAQKKADRQQVKVDERNEREAEAGRPLRGRRPKKPDASVDPVSVANPTDPDSEIIKGPHGYVQGLSAQCVVSNSQIILAKYVTSDANDRRQLVPALLMCMAALGS